MLKVKCRQVTILEYDLSHFFRAMPLKVVRKLRHRNFLFCRQNLIIVLCFVKAQRPKQAFRLFLPSFCTFCTLYKGNKTLSYIIQKTMFLIYIGVIFKINLRQLPQDTPFSARTQVRGDFGPDSSCSDKGGPKQLMLPGILEVGLVYFHDSGKDNNMFTV